MQDKSYDYLYFSVEIIQSLVTIQDKTMFVFSYILSIFMLKKLEASLIQTVSIFNTLKAYIKFSWYYMKKDFSYKQPFCLKK